MAPILFPRKGSSGGGGRGGGFGGGGGLASGGSGDGKHRLLPLWIFLGTVGGIVVICLVICLWCKISSVMTRRKRRVADAERDARNNPIRLTRGANTPATTTTTPTTQPQQQQQLQVPAATDARRSADVTEARGEVMTEISLADPPKVQQGDAAK